MIQSHKRVTSLIPTFMLLVAASAQSAAPNMKEGLWEVTVKMEMPGMPGNMPAQTTQRCITAKDMEDPRKVGPGNDQGSNTCEVTNYKMQGNTASWNMSCKGREPMTGTGTIKYEGDRYSGVNRMSMTQGKDTMQMTMNYSGRYLGACKSGQK
jgi:hypothetical protein